MSRWIQDAAASGGVCERGGARMGPFQPQIAIAQLHGLRSQPKKAKFAAFAVHAELCFGKQHVVRIQSQNFGGPQTLQKH